MKFLGFDLDFLSGKKTVIFGTINMIVMFLNIQFNSSIDSVELKGMLEQLFEQGDVIFTSLLTLYGAVIKLVKIIRRIYQYIKDKITI